MSNTRANSEEKETNSIFDFQKVVEPFNEKDYNADYILTNNILRYQLKHLDTSNYGKCLIYDKDKMDFYKDKLIDKYNSHFFPHELCFNMFRNIYKEEKILMNFSQKLKKKKLRDYEDRDDELCEKNKEKEQDKEGYEGERYDEEIGSVGDYNFDYNKSEDEFENEENDENII